MGNPIKRNETKLNKYLGRDTDPIPKEKAVKKIRLPKEVSNKPRGRPRQLDPANHGLQEGEQRCTFIAKKEQIQSMMDIKKSKGALTKEVFAEALEDYINKFYNR